MLFLYRFFLACYTAALHIAALWHHKAKQWVSGRASQKQQLQAIKEAPASQRIWMHCASLGEFEQGRPVLEALHIQYPAALLILTFFSPSGYEIRKDYEGADYVLYLPMDGPGNARTFLDAVQPSLVLFVKYEFWYYYLKALQQRHIPTLLISAAFRPSQAFFKGYGGFFRRILHCFTYILVQDRQSADLLAGIGIRKNVQIGGDTRYDRVAQIGQAVMDLPLIAAFKGNGQLMIAGSTWPEDEALLAEKIALLPPGWKLVIAPHEIHEAHIKSILALFPQAAIRYSSLVNGETVGDHKVLLIDNIGMLSSLYQYGTIAYVGGGFNKGGIHNILEPAVFGLPVLFGPVYEKFVEAVELAQLGYVFPVTDANAYQTILLHLLNDNAYREEIKGKLLQFMKDHTGATDQILELMEQQKWI